jgi:AraC family transcriptional regulator
MVDQPKVLIESNYSIERRTLSRRSMEQPPHQDFSILYTLCSPGPSLPEHAVVFANPNQPLRLTADVKGSELLLVRLAPALLIETAARLKLHREGSLLLFRRPLTVMMDDARLRGALIAIGKELAANDAGWREVIGSLIGQLAVYLLRMHINVRRSEEIELSRVGMVDRRLRRAVEFMHDHCGREIPLAEIAGVAYLSEFHFARLFKKIIGVTPHTYLASLRIERARRMLADSDRTIAEIGAEVGYANQSHFTKVFREATGLAPRAFREAARKIE